jgi:hypothetical protein
MSLKGKNIRDKPKNSSMVNNEKELEQHSRVMEQMCTNTQIKKNNKTPDPNQFNNKE